jgi:aminoglycoside phosphotransferase family enzyme/predicted kinase
MTDSTLPPLIQQMMKPDFYLDSAPSAVLSAHPTAYPEYPEDFYPPLETSIQLIQTHVSYVLLTGEYAYKLKKPVNFGFLDYSTLEKRKFYCDEELRLNQRTASELYLEVLPVLQLGSDAVPQYRLGKAGESTEKVVDYVVKMRQFPQSALLTTWFDRGELNEALIEELARVIADFHAHTETNDYIRSFGEVAQGRQAFDENFEQTEQYIGGPQTQQQFDETRAYCDRFFATQKALFDERMQTDRIRECHGDLHLRNICYWNDRLWLFDCIEFNEPFRFVDVMFDIAYIVMDLEARQRQDLSNLFLNTYIEQTGDWEGLQVLPIYVSRQTYVRAKVTSFLLNDPAVPEAEKQKAADTAALYYRLAWKCSQTKAGKLFMMSGLSGSGKTTVARQLARQTNAIHIRSDAVRKHLGGIPLMQRGGDDLYTPEMTQKTYDRLLDLGIKLANQGYTVILDAKYDRQALRQPVIAAAAAHDLSVQILHCDAPSEVLRDRLNQRTGDIADATADLLPKQQLEPFTEAERPYINPIDTTQPIAPQLNQRLGNKRSCK